ncbi:MAG: hypothetical protein M3443_19490 [Actinomycetota bacterium]|nr:hypothetical protein [Actinomycetota bacterium]
MLIQHSINTISPFLAVYGDELATKRGTGRHFDSGAAATNLPLELFNDALGHASAGDHVAVADVMRLRVTLDDQQRAVALSNIVHIALVVGELVCRHRSEETASG